MGSLALKIGRDDKFHWGVNIDDAWKYTGLGIPKSTILPYLFSTRFREGAFTLPGENEGRSDHVGGPASRTSDGIMDNSLNAPSAEHLASFLKKNGVDFVRCWFQWNFFDQSKYGGRSSASSSYPSSPSSGYVFPLDDFVSKMSEAGIEVIGAIGSGYHRFLPIGVEANHLGRYLKQLTDSSTEIIRHYKDKVKVWQIENEPDWWREHYISHWRRGTIWLNNKNREPILRALYNVVRAECPDGTIVVNLEAENMRQDWKLYARYSDIIGLDFYPNYMRTAPIDAAELRTHSLRARKETGLPIFVIETGYPSGPGIFGFDEAKQRHYVRSACEVAYACDAITGLGWFRFSDSYWKSFPSQENHFGLLTREGRPKLGWNEYVTQVRQKR
jgi:hypothetical protein